jgi:hypothetical protein
MSSWKWRHIVGSNRSNVSEDTAGSIFFHPEVCYVKSIADDWMSMENWLEWYWQRKNRITRWKICASVRVPRPIQQALDWHRTRAPTVTTHLIKVSVLSRPSTPSLKYVPMVWWWLCAKHTRENCDQSSEMCFILHVRVKQSHYRPGQGSRRLRLSDFKIIGIRML